MMEMGVAFFSQPLNKRYGNNNYQEISSTEAIDVAVKTEQWIHLQYLFYTYPIGFQGYSFRLIFRFISYHNISVISS